MLVLCWWWRRWTYCIGTNVRRTSNGSCSFYSSTRPSDIYSTFRWKYSVLFSMSMYQTWSSTSLFTLWKMCSTLWSSLSLVKYLHCHSKFNDKDFSLGRIVAFHLLIINTSFYFLVMPCYSVFMLRQHHSNILFYFGKELPILTR